MALGSAGRSAIEKFVDTGNPFKHGNLSGTRNEIKGLGRLPSQWHWQLRNADLEVSNPDGVGFSVLYSYDTPIAWRFGNRPNEWIIPNVNYSPATTNHQRVVMGETHGRNVIFPESRILSSFSTIRRLS